MFYKHHSSLTYLSFQQSFIHITTVSGWNRELNDHLCRAVRKAGFCICENKEADQIRGNREAVQCLCFRYLDSTITLLCKSEISSL